MLTVGCTKENLSENLVTPETTITEKGPNDDIDIPVSVVVISVVDLIGQPVPDVFIKLRKLGRNGKPTGQPLRYQTDADGLTELTDRRKNMHRVTLRLSGQRLPVEDFTIIGEAAYIVVDTESEG